MILKQNLANLLRKVIHKKFNLNSIIFNSASYSVNKYNFQQQHEKKNKNDGLINDKNEKNKKIFVKFEDEILLRRNQAKKSILFKINTDGELYALVDDIDKIESKIKKIFVMNFENNFKSVLIEFETYECVENILNNYGHHFSNDDLLPSKTRLLFYRRTNKNFIPPSKNLTFTNSNWSSNSKNVLSYNTNDFKNQFSFLKQITNTDEQITKFYQNYQINDINYRIRFFVATIIEESFYSLFKNCICIPFGSSANKFGNLWSDLDLLFSFDDKFKLTNENEKYLEKQNKLNGKMVYFTKFNKNEVDRNIARQFLELSKFILEKILPKFSIRQIIKSARVPILEFDFELPSYRINCDLSMSNLEISFQMTKLFWIYSNLDKRVPALIFLIKYWARLTHVTNTSRPSPNITNFQITVLTLNFLLRLDNPLIVPVESIVTHVNQNQKNISQNDYENKYIINDYFNLNDIKSMIKNNNEILLKDLLIGFFNYYSNFDFNSNMVSLFRNLKLKKSDQRNESLFIQNPFVPELNASKNVNRQNLKKFTELCNDSYVTIHEIINKDTKNYDIVHFFNSIKEKSKKYKNNTFENNTLADEMNIY